MSKKQSGVKKARVICNCGKTHFVRAPNLDGRYQKKFHCCGDHVIKNFHGDTIAVPIEPFLIAGEFKV